MVDFHAWLCYLVGMLQRQYKIIVEQDEDGYFVATAPALPGCYTQAKTLPLLKKRIKEAIILCLEEVKSNTRYRRKIKVLAYEPTFVGLQTVEI